MPAFSSANACQNGNGVDKPSASANARVATSRRRLGSSRAPGATVPQLSGRAAPASPHLGAARPAPFGHADRHAAVIRLRCECVWMSRVGNSSTRGRGRFMSRVSRPDPQDRRNGVVSLKLARERLGRPRGRSSGTVLQRPGRSAWNSEATDKQAEAARAARNRERRASPPCRRAGSPDSRLARRPPIFRVVPRARHRCRSLHSAVRVVCAWQVLLGRLCSNASTG